MASPIAPDSADPRDESAFTPFTLWSAQDLAEATGAEAEAAALPILLPVLTLVAIFVFPSALSGVGFMAVRALGSNIDVSTAAGTAFSCVRLQSGARWTERRAAPRAGALLAVSGGQPALCPVALTSPTLPRHPPTPSLARALPA